MVTTDSIIFQADSIVIATSGVPLLQFYDLGLGLLMAGIKNLIIEKGATFNTIFTWSTKDTLGVITPVNLSTWSARAQVREEYESTTPVLSLTSQPSGGITLGGFGTIELKVSPTLTSAVLIDKGVWDLELEDSAGNVIRLLEGKVTFKPEVTR